MYTHGSIKYILLQKIHHCRIRGQEIGYELSKYLKSHRRHYVSTHKIHTSANNVGYKSKYIATRELKSMRSRNDSKEITLKPVVNTNRHGKTNKINEN